MLNAPTYAGLVAVFVYSKDRQEMFCTQFKTIHREGLCIFWSGHIRPPVIWIIIIHHNSLESHSAYSGEDTVERTLATMTPITIQTATSHPV